MRVLRTYFSVILLAIVMFSIVPKEFIHDLYGHQDTVENVDAHKGRLWIEAVHHHCEILSYSAFPYLAGTVSLQTQAVPVFFVKPVEKKYDFFNRDRYNLSRFRAPPAIV